MNIVKNEKALPTKGRYVRSLCDPRVLMHGNTGECYTRRDGALWEWAGYSVADGKVEPLTAPEDSARYRPTTEAAA